MTTQREQALQKLWQGHDPFSERSSFRGRVDFQGWASSHPYLAEAIESVRPATVVEIGVWKGGSVITMAEKAKSLNLDTVIIAVDTWLGAADHWYQAEWFAHLRIESGYPTLYKTFAANILEKGFEDYVVPLPMDSLNAADLFAHRQINPDLIHIDGGHSYDSVLADLRAWWPRLRAGGVLVGDDYHPEGVPTWPEVRRAFHDFFKTTNIRNAGGKCYIVKPPQN